MTNGTPIEKAKAERDRIHTLLADYEVRKAVESIALFSRSYFDIESTTFKTCTDKAILIRQTFARAEEIKFEDEATYIVTIKKLTVEITAFLTFAINTLSIQPINNPSPGSGTRDPVFENGIVVSLKECRKDFGRSSFSLGPISMEIERGDTVALMGANASGKSTLLRLMLGELALTSGSITYPGLPIAHTFRSRRSRIGYVPQFPPPWKGPLRDNLHFYLATRGIFGAENQSRVNHYINLFDLSRFSQLSWVEISGGFRLRFALARELLTEPSLLVMDEPLAHLDVISQVELLDIIRNLSKQHQRPLTVVFTSQHIYETERFCSKVAVLKDGTLRIYDKLAALPNDHNLFLFELETLAERSLIQSSLGNHHFRISGTCPVYILTFYSPLSIDTVTRHLSNGAVPIKAIRDISHSSRIYFDAKPASRMQ
jgi:ABC-2 type transport system ATP-binding protein